MFTTSCGWLKYRPFSKYELPTAYYVTEDDHKPVEVEFANQKGEVRFTRRLWRLKWPGELGDERAGEALVPAGVVERWPKYKPTPGEGQSHYSVRHILDNGWLPDEVPETIAYHVAVNHKALGFDAVPFAVCGLPAARVQQVIDARFAIDSEAHAALSYLKWAAESHRRMPLFQPFDTSIREGLMTLAQEAVWLYFWLLSDYLYDAESRYWERDGKWLWPRLATYLHWVGRTGMGLYGFFGRLERLDRSEKRAVQEFADAPDLAARLEEWNLWTMRNHMRDDDRELVTEVEAEVSSHPPDPDQTVVPPRSYSG